MSIQNINLKRRTMRAISLQESDLFVVDQRNELPLPKDSSLERMAYSSERDEHGHYYDYQTSWGYFSVDSDERSLLYLRKGNPPESLLPQPRLSLATATMHAGYLAIHNNGSSFELDMKSPEKLHWGALQLVNDTLKTEGLPIVVWELDEAKGETPPVIRIYNDSAMVFASSAVWSLEDQQLVAAQVVTTSQELLKAIKATLANNNSKSYLSVKTPDDSAYLKGARRGFVSVSNQLGAANADGTVTALLHPLTGDPQASSSDYFYLIISAKEDLSRKFAERLDLSIPWPIRTDWAPYLLEAGKRAGLLEVLPTSGKDFSAALRIKKNEALWQQVISQGLRQGQISIS
jgi:hypothetical protein